MHEIPELRYIVLFLACFIGVFLFANASARVLGHKD